MQLPGHLARRRARIAMSQGSPERVPTQLCCLIAWSQGTQGSREGARQRHTGSCVIQSPATLHQGPRNGSLFLHAELCCSSSRLGGDHCLHLPTLPAPWSFNRGVKVAKWEMRNYFLASDTCEFWSTLSLASSANQDKSFEKLWLLCHICKVGLWEGSAR